MNCRTAGSLGLAMLVSFFAVSAAQAQSQRTFVASTGSDANPCSRTAPCRNFAAALAAVQSGGEIIALDSAGYGTVTIDRSVTVVAPDGVYAGVATFSGHAITIDAAGATVALRGLTINALTSSLVDGVHVTAAAVVHISKCTITNFPNAAVDFPGPVDFFITDLVARENVYGVFVYLTSGTLFGSINRSEFDDNGNSGVYLASSVPAQVTIRDSVLSFNNGYGIDVTSLASADVKNCTVSKNRFYGIAVDATGSVSVAGSMVNDNGVGFESGGGTFRTFGDNDLNGNTTATQGGITTVLRQ